MPQLALIRDLDPEEARAVVDPVLHVMIEAVNRYGGYVAQSTGDGIFAMFGAPVGHEDHLQRALHSARDATRASSLWRKVRKEGRSRIEVRIGVNTGEVVARMIETGGHGDVE